MSVPLSILGLISGSSLDGLDMALCTFQYNDAGEIEWKIVKTSGQPFPQSLQDQLSKSTFHNAALETDKPEKNYFSMGSSLGEVIIAQGEPTKMEDNIWYYGESTVTFTNGLVSEWNRHPLYPLNAVMKDTSAFTSPPNKPGLHSQETVKKPYWSK